MDTLQKIKEPPIMAIMIQSMPFHLQSAEAEEGYSFQQYRIFPFSDKVPLLAVRKANHHNHSVIWYHWFALAIAKYLVNANKISGLLKPWYLDLNSMASFALVSRWIKNCLRDHQRCKVSNQEIYLLTQLLNLRLKDQNKVCIVSTISIRTLDKIYAIMSYCQGLAMHRAALTTVTCLSAHVPCVRVASLPKTFVNVIRLTRML